MKLNLKSFHVWLYKITYTTNNYDKRLPTNLCPYFWKLVFAFIVFIPNIILQIPIHIFDLFSYNKFDNRIGEYRIFGLITYVGIGFVLGYIYTIIQWFKMMFNAYSYDYRLAIVGYIVTSILAIIFIVIGILEYYENKEYVYKEKKPSIIKEFIKAKYNKYCPKIDWE